MKTILSLVQDIIIPINMGLVTFAPEVGVDTILSNLDVLFQYLLSLIS